MTLEEFYENARGPLNDTFEYYRATWIVIYRWAPEYVFKAKIDKFEWLKENCKGDWIYSTGYVFFQSIDDAMLFKLTWL